MISVIFVLFLFYLVFIAKRVSTDQVLALLFKLSWPFIALNFFNSIKALQHYPLM